MSKNNGRSSLVVIIIVIVGLLLGFSKAFALVISNSIYLPLVMKDYPPLPTATPTIIPTATEMPTATATLINTPIPVGVQILNNYSTYVDSIDYLHIVGEVLNYTGNHLEFVKISANFYNSSGQFIATDYTYTDLWYLPSHEKTCFDLMLELPVGYSYFEFEPPYYWTSGQPLPLLTVFNDSGTYLSNYGWYKIIGQVRNDAGRRVEYVMPVMTLYNGLGNVVDCDYTFVNSTHLDAGQVSSFENTFIGANYTGVTSYRIQVDGN